MSHRPGSVVSLALGAVLLAGASCGPARESSPKAVILLVGDGLGPSQIAFARSVKKERGERFSFETLPSLGLVSTWSASNQVTDSGAAATAFAAGVKTDNNVVGITPAGEDLETLADRARENGWKIGYVTNTSITHATPAAFYASVKDRYLDVDSIAVQLLEQGPDVALGGGLDDFLPYRDYGRRQDDRNLVEDAEARGYTVLRHGADLGPAMTDDPPEKLLGLLAGGHLPFRIDNRRLPEAQRYASVKELTRLALASLSKGSGSFFLMVEGGRIDHAGHSFDAATLAEEVADFDEAVEVVLEYQKAHPETLVLVTADHATGGLAVNDFTDWDEIEAQNASVDWIRDEIRDEEDPADLETVRQRTGQQEMREEDLGPIRLAGDKYDAGRLLGTRLAELNGVTWLPRVDPWDTKGHTGEDVPLYAAGPGAERFEGSLDNTDIPRRLCRLLGWAELNPGV